MEIFWISGSPPAWRVLLCLEAKGLEYRSHILENSRKEQKESWFLEINPRGQVPVLRDEDTIITESMAIMRYLEARQPEPAIFGNSLAEKAVIEQRVQEILSYVDPAFSRFVQPVFRNRLDQLRESLDDTATAIQGELAMLEIWLGDDNRDAGNFTAVDIALIPAFQRLVRAIEREPDAARELGLDNLSASCPKLWAWDQQMRTLPVFDATFPPHWRNG